MSACVGSGNFCARLARKGSLRLVLLWSLASACRVMAGDCVPADGLVGWWPGDGNANDVAGSNDGILQGGATASAGGVAGAAFHFDGTNDYAEIPDSPALRPTNLTIEAWVRFDSLDSLGSGNSPEGEQYLVFREGAHLQYFSGFALRKVRTGGGDAFEFEVDSADGQAVKVTSHSLVVTGVWYHVAGVRATSYVQLYVNGQLEGQAHVGFPQSYGDFPLYFGTTAQPAWDHKLAGDLDEVALYDRALSPSRIAASYSSPAEGKCKPRVVQQPQSQTTKAGTDVVFEVTALGAGPLGYQWQFNGANLADGPNCNGATGSRLAINHVQWGTCHEAIYSVVVTNPSGAVTSAPATLTVIPPSPGDPVPFADSNLESAVRTALSTSTGSLALSNLWGLTALSAFGQHITNLAGLEFATNLISLYLPGNGISDLAPLQCLHRLTQLALYHNRIVDLSPLATLSSLTNLNLGDNLISDASPLSNLTELTALWLYGNRLSKLSFVANLSHLGSLALDRNNIGDASPLTNLTSLSTLYLGGNPTLFEFRVLSTLTNLASLSLREASIGDLGVLQPLRRLTWLDLYGAYHLRNLSPLTNFADLSHLDLSLNSGITNCSVVARCYSLTNLYLRGVPVRNATFLTNLSRLSFLNLDSTGISNASPLAELTNVTYLAMTGNPTVSNVHVLSNLTRLVNLELRASCISNIGFMSSLSRLRYADLAYNQITDISPLGVLTNLDSLVLAGNPTNDYVHLLHN